MQEHENSLQSPFNQILKVFPNFAAFLMNKLNLNLISKIRQFLSNLRLWKFQFLTCFRKNFISNFWEYMFWLQHFAWNYLICNQYAPWESITGNIAGTKFSCFLEMGEKTFYPHLKYRGNISSNKGASKAQKMTLKKNNIFR